MPLKKIAIIGGGAKAAALVSKIACIAEIEKKHRRKLPVNRIEAVVFERNKVGSNWCGEAGYTDGEQFICTPAERDVGFPYSLSHLGPEVTQRMYEKFSWGSFLVQTGMYGDWVNRGRGRPTHKEFAEYLSFCIAKSKAKLVIGEVTKLRVKNKKWAVSCTGVREKTLGDFDGVVVTGPGPASRRVVANVTSGVFDGTTFWSSLSQVSTIAKSEIEMPIVIAGSGGTAAAIAGWLTRNGFRNEIRIIGEKAALFARVDSAFENRTFMDGDVWASLSFKDRSSFTDRLNRGAVWSNVLDSLSGAKNVSYVAGRVLQVDPVKENSKEMIQAKFSRSASPNLSQAITACIFVDATGFDETWFSKLLTPGLASQILANKEKMQENMGSDLSLPLKAIPPLHAPWLSQVVGPGFSSLMALGAMSDAVLRRYA